MAVDHVVARLTQAEAGAGAPVVGEVRPDFAMPDQDGRIVRLSDIVAHGPTVLAFHRGHWCPYCRLNMVGLAEIQDQLGDAKIYAISAEKQEHTQTLRSESGARFPFQIGRAHV